jgi:uncharacterized membrane protein YcaP (DUF421 family)
MFSYSYCHPSLTDDSPRALYATRHNSHEEMMDAAMFQLSVPWWEIVLRGSLMFWFLFLIFRCLLRRDMGNVGIGDFLFVVIVADASQNAMSGDAKSIGDGMSLVAVLAGWNLLLDWLSFRSPSVRRLLEAPPLPLIHHGQLQIRAMRREFITKEEILAKLREAGIEKISQVKHMQLETDGQLSIIPYDKK